MGEVTPNARSRSYATRMGVNWYNTYGEDYGSTAQVECDCHGVRIDLAQLKHHANFSSQKFMLNQGQDRFEI